MGETANNIALVVDDDRLVRIINTTILNKVGFKVIDVENGKKAVDLFKSGARFNLIVMDMQMPVMNGVQATKELRALGADCLIIGVTANNDESAKQEFMEAGLNHVFEKPLTADKVAYSLNNF